MIEPKTRTKLYKFAQLPAGMKNLRLEAARLADTFGMDVPELPSIDLPDGLKSALQKSLNKPLR